MAKRPGEVNLRVVFADDRDPTLNALDLLVDGLKPLLKEYAKAFVGEDLNWDISRLEFSSIGIGVFPDQSVKPHLDDPLRNMSMRLVTDLASLERGSYPESTPLGHDKRTWTKWVQLVTTENVIRVDVTTEGVSTSLTASGAGKIEAPHPPGTVVDTVRGTIQGVNFSHGTYFTLHRDGDNHPIRCHFRDSMEEAVVSSLRKRVAVTGRVKRNDAGEYQSVDVTLPPRKLRAPSEIPRAADLVGISPDLEIAELLVADDQGVERAL